MTDLSISIITINKQLISDCLNSIYATTAQLNIEVFVIINDPLCAREIQVYIQKHHPQINIIANKTIKGFTANHNVVMKQCKGRYVLVLNDDTIILENTLEKMVAYMDNRPDIGVLGCKIVNPDNTLQWSCGKSFDYKFEYFKAGVLRTLLSPLINDTFYDSTQEVNWVTGACLMVRQKTIDEVGLFDENIYMYFDDGDLCLRITEAGWKVVYYHDAIIIHYRSQTSKNFLAKTTAIYFQSRLYFFSKHYSNQTVFFIRILTVFDAIVQYAKIALLPSRKNINKANLFATYMGAIKLSLTYRNG